MSRSLYFEVPIDDWVPTKKLLQFLRTLKVVNAMGRHMSESNEGVSTIAVLFLED